MTTLAAHAERIPIAAAVAASVLLHAWVLALGRWESPHLLEVPPPLTVELVPQPLPLAPEPAEPVRPPAPPAPPERAKARPPPDPARPSAKPVARPEPEPKPVAPPAASPSRSAPVLSTAPVPMPAEPSTAPAASGIPANPAPAGPAEGAPSAAADRRASAAPPSVAATPPAFGAAYLRNPAPRYPPDARRSGAEGTVLLRVWVAADGGTARVEVDHSSGHRALDDAALAAVKNWRFVPAQRGGEAVEGVVTVPLVFRLDGRG